MRIFWGAILATLLAGAMAFAQDYQAPPSQEQDNAAPAVSPDNSYQAAPVQAEPANGEIRENNGEGVTIEGNAAASTAESMEGVPAVNYQISHLAKEEQRGSLLPDEPYSGISGTLSSWDTSPTGVYKDSRQTTGSPFPLAAAPSIDLGNANLLPDRVTLPSAMAGNVSSWDTSPTATYKDYELMNGSPFPMSAAPPVRLGHGLLESVDEGADFSKGTGQPFADTASPFPTAGAQPRRKWY